jgi:hypothetical protein
MFLLSFFFFFNNQLHRKEPKHTKALTRREEKEVDLFHYIWEIERGWENKEGMQLEINLSCNPIYHMISAEICTFVNFFNLSKRASWNK